MSPNRTCGDCKHFCPSDEGTCEFGENHEWGFSDDDVCENFSAKCSVGEAVQELVEILDEVGSDLAVAFASTPGIESKIWQDILKEDIQKICAVLKKTRGEK